MKHLKKFMTWDDYYNHSYIEKPNVVLVKEDNQLTYTNILHFDVNSNEIVISLTYDMDINDIMEHFQNYYWGENVELTDVEKLKKGYFRLVFNNTVTVLDENVFADYTRDVRMPEYGIEEIRNNAFYQGHCEEVVFPNTVRIIGERCFDNSPGLRKLTIPYSVEEIGRRIFDEEVNVISVTYEGTMDEWHTLYDDMYHGTAEDPYTDYENWGKNYYGPDADYKFAVKCNDGVTYSFKTNQAPQ